MNNSGVLYILGNGFDLAHGLRTRYQDFKDWLLENCHECFVRRMEALYPSVVNNNGEWNDIERALGVFNFEEVTSFDINFTDCGDPEEANLGAGANIKTVTNVLPILLRNWIETIRFDNVDKKFQLEGNCMIISFNYTQTVEQVYGINSERVFHIHSSVKEPSKELIIGYRPEDGYDNEVWDTGRTDDNAIRHNLLTNMIKPFDSLLDLLRRFFPQLSQVSDVRVIGHSCSRIDEPYFMKIARAIYKDAMWKFYIYNDNMKGVYESFAKRITQQCGLKQTYKIKNCKELLVE
jgi:hypothetical protein